MRHLSECFQLPCPACAPVALAPTGRTHTRVPTHPCRRSSSPGSSRGPTSLRGAVMGSPAQWGRNGCTNPPVGRPPVTAPQPLWRPHPICLHRSLVSSVRATSLSLSPESHLRVGCGGTWGMQAGGRGLSGGPQPLPPPGAEALAPGSLSPGHSRWCPRARERAPAPSAASVVGCPSALQTGGKGGKVHESAHALTQLTHTQAHSHTHWHTTHSHTDTHTHQQPPRGAGAVLVQQPGLRAASTWSPFLRVGVSLVTPSRVYTRLSHFPSRVHFIAVTL